jgi:hypothetical protein
MSNELDQLGVNPLMAGLAQQGVKTAGARMRAYIPGLSGLWDALRYHFHVDNVYMLRKMKLLIFPKQKVWHRTTPTTPGVSKSLPPVVDINAPDLYLPVMSFVTFSLLAGLLQGTLGKFDPAYIQSTIMFSFTLLSVEAIAARFAFGTILQVPTISIMDFVCYSGYRYFGLCLILLVETASRGTASLYYIMLLWLGVANSLFLYQSLGASISNAHMKKPAGGINKNGAMLVAFGYSVLQLLIMWYLSAFKMDSASTESVFSAAKIPDAVISSTTSITSIATSSSTTTISVSGGD